MINKIRLSIETNLDVILSSIFEELSISKSENIDNKKVAEIVSIFNYICKENKIFTVQGISKKDIESYAPEYDFDVLLELFSECAIFSTGVNDYDQVVEEIKTANKGYNHWKSLYSSRKTSLEKAKPVQEVNESSSKQKLASEKDSTEVKENESKSSTTATKQGKDSIIGIWNVENFVSKFNKENIIIDKIISKINNETKLLFDEYNKQIKDDIFVNIVKLFNEDNKNLSEIELLNLLNNELKNLDFDRIMSLTKDLIDGLEGIISSELHNIITLVITVKPEIKNSFKDILKTILTFTEKTVEVKSPLLNALSEEILYILNPIAKDLEVEIKTLNLNSSSCEEELSLPTLEEIKKDFKESLERFSKILRKEFKDIKISWNQCKYYFDTYNSKLLYNSIVAEADSQSIYNNIINEIYNSGLEEVKEFDTKNSKTSKMMNFIKGIKSSKSEETKKEVKETSSKQKPVTSESSTEEKQNEQSTEKVEKLEDKVENALEAYNTESSITSEEKDSTEEKQTKKEKEDKVIEKKIILHYPIDPAKMMSDEEINLFNEFMEVEGSINGTKPETVNYLHNKAAKINELFNYLSEDDKYLVPYHLNINEIFEEQKIAVKDITNDKVIVEAIVKGIDSYANNKRNSAPQLSKLGMQIAEFETLLTGKDLPILNL